MQAVSFGVIEVLFHGRVEKHASPPDLKNSGACRYTDWQVRPSKPILHHTGPATVSTGRMNTRRTPSFVNIAKCNLENVWKTFGKRGPCTPLIQVDCVMGMRLLINNLTSGSESKGRFDRKQLSAGWIVSSIRLVPRLCITECYVNIHRLEFPFVVLFRPDRVFGLLKEQFIPARRMFCTRQQSVSFNKTGVMPASFILSVS